MRPLEWSKGLQLRGYARLVWQGRKRCKSTACAVGRAGLCAPLRDVSGQIGPRRGLMYTFGPLGNG